MQHPIPVQHHPAVSQFQVHSHGQTALLEYHLRHDHITFTHTEVPETMAGQGVGAALAMAGLEYAREHNLEVLPLCPFVKGYIERHREYEPLLLQNYHQHIDGSGTEK